MNVKKLIFRVTKPVTIPLTNVVLKRHYKADKPLSGTKGAKKIVILAPHMDDETIGPGGTIKKHANEGAEIHCIFTTDGSKSVSDLSKEELMKVRMEEINAVKQILGLTKVHSLGLPDGRVVSDQAAQARLKEMLEEIQPDIIYSTLFVDAHPDHTATAKILSDTLKQMPESDYTIRLYEINCAIPPEYINCVVDISDTLKDKEAAIDQFQSQAIAFDGFLALNRIKRKLTKNKVNAVEGFLELSVQELIRHDNGLDNFSYNYPRLFKQVNRTDTLLWAIYQNRKLKREIYQKTLS